MASVDTMQDLVLIELRQAYGTERLVDEALPELLDHVSSPGLMGDLQEMQATSKRQQERLTQVFKHLDQEAKADNTGAAEAILDQIKGIAKWKSEGMVRDAALIAAAQQYAHYLIASYGNLRAHARALGHAQAEEIFGNCVEDEARIDEMLTRRAESEVNVEAAGLVPTR